MTGPISPTIYSVAVFCGSNFGTRADYAEAARELGDALGRRGWQLVYGGTDKGLMGIVAQAALAAGSPVHGVITRRLADRGHLAPGLTRHEIVPDMSARKRRMAALADAFIALPGGLGTFEELFEAATLTQLGEHAKPCGVLDVSGFFAPMRALLEHATAEGFLKPEHRDMIVATSNPDDLLNQLQTWTPPVVSKWIDQPDA
ncbi:TIGR00730 family Rossman fold protein [Burkholderia sp. 22PA0099]|uniref:LOG family protein n=1 Tax=Burkholderia sp. 22PA0099 TaxID=3237372 RepID=UPI0039C475DE